MGASSTREKIESRMLKLKLRRVEIKQERMERVKQLEKLTGKEIIREPIPDYIDHSEDEINVEDMNENEEIEEENIINIKKEEKKKNKKNKKKKKDEDEEEEDSYEDKLKNSKKKKNNKTSKGKHYQVTNQ